MLPRYPPQNSINSRMGVPMGTSTFPRTAYALAGDGNDAAHQRFAVPNETVQRVGGAHVMAQAPGGERVAPAGHFSPGDDFNELAFPAGGIDRRHAGVFDPFVAEPVGGVSHGPQSFGLIPLDDQHGEPGAHQFQQGQRAPNDFERGARASACRRN